MVPVVCGVVQLIVLPFLPESPSYLYMQGDRRGARRAITRFQSEAVADEYLGDLALVDGKDQKVALLLGGGAPCELQLRRVGHVGFSCIFSYIKGAGS